MPNNDIGAARSFHDATKLSYIRLATKPPLYKEYPGAAVGGAAAGFAVAGYARAGGGGRAGGAGRRAAGVGGGRRNCCTIPPG